MAEEIIISVNDGNGSDIEIFVNDGGGSEITVENEVYAAEIIVENPAASSEIIVENPPIVSEITVENGATIIYNGGGNPGFGYEKYTYLDGLVQTIEIFEDDTEAVLLYTQNFVYFGSGNVSRIETVRESDLAVVSTEDFTYDINGDLLTYYKY